ncbi:MAG: hypothetical protein VB082_09155 [Christensenella sp.]|nr:hypothetical protein [Christensenella sp.]
MGSKKIEDINIFFVEDTDSGLFYRCFFNKGDTGESGYNPGDPDDFFEISKEQLPII